VVLAADAHAWAEVEITPGVWMTFDPTPPAWTPMGRREPATFAQRMTWIYGWFEDAWQTRVLGFNSESQETIVDDVLPWWTTLTQSTTQSIGEFLVTVNLAFGIGLGGYIWMGVVVMIVVLSIIVWQQGRRRRRIVLKAVSLDSKGQRTERSVARRYVFYVDMLRLLDRADLSKPSWQSPAAFAHSLELTHPNVARCVDRIVQRFYAMRFGGETPAQDHIQRTQEDLHALSSELETLS
jgi:heme exporter protein D